MAENKETRKAEEDIPGKTRPKSGVTEGSHTQERQDCCHTHMLGQGNGDSHTWRSTNKQKGATVIQEETRRTKTNNGAILWEGRGWGMVERVRS
jgi:hypothetical protein